MKSIRKKVNLVNDCEISRAINQLMFLIVNNNCCVGTKLNNSILQVNKVSSAQGDWPTARKTGLHPHLSIVISWPGYLVLAESPVIYHDIQ